MLKTRHIIFIFLPAILIAGFALFIQIVQYRSANEAENPETASIQIPVFPDDPILGDKKAGITVIAFEDFGCPGCKDQSDIFNELLDKYPGKIKIIWKGLPVTRFPFSTRRTNEYAFCANRQGKFSAFK
ncbi:MAG: thioredoxin domain-containing protein, partial [Patescibacteria group bacterium]